MKYASLLVSIIFMWVAADMFLAVPETEAVDEKASGEQTSGEQAADNQLTAEEKAAGWQLLFNGHDLTGWRNCNDKPLVATVEDGALVPYKAGSDVVVYDKPFGDFILKCDVRQSKSNTNSGVFLRIGDLKNPVYTGIEAQVYSGGVGVNDFGAIYDLVAPTKDLVKPVGEWNQMQITCRGPLITVEVNGELVTTMNCDDFDQPGLRPDGSKHKFRRAIKEFDRNGYLGFQDHGGKVWFKNVKLLELPAEAATSR